MWLPFRLPRSRRPLAGAACLVAVALAAGCQRANDHGTDSEAVVPLRTRVIGGGTESELFAIQGAAFRGSRLVVLTSPEPALHLYDASAAVHWGKSGEGPSELKGSQNVGWVGDHLLVRDFRLRKIVSYDDHGNFLAARPLGALSTTRMELAGNDTLLMLLNPFERTRVVVRLAGERTDTVLRFQASEQTLTLEGGNAPSLTLTPPFAAEPRWTALPGGRIAFWNGTAADLQLLDRTGREVARLPLPADRIAVAAADRDAWLMEAIPAEAMFGKADAFAPVREKARREVVFPTELPAVLELRGDPSGDVWVRRSTAGTGELWTRVGRSGPVASVRFPPRRKLLAVGDAEMAVRALDDSDIESVEVYRKPTP